MYRKESFTLDANAIGNAINLIVRGEAQRCEISNQVKVYKVPSANPNKYIIRIDVKEEIGDDDGGRKKKKTLKIGFGLGFIPQGIYSAGMPNDKQTETPMGIYQNMGWRFQKSGIPDLLMCVNGIFIAAELKSSVGKPTDLQRKNIEMVNRGGGIGLVLYPEGFEQFKEIVKGVVECPNLITLKVKPLANSKFCDSLTRTKKQNDKMKNKTKQM